MKIDNTAPLAIDAINMLITDHCAVEECFSVFRRISDGKPEQRKTLVEQICQALKMHMAIEEEIFYPAVREILVEEKDRIWEGVIEHDKARALMEQLEAMQGDEPTLTQRVDELAALVMHHVKEEENDLFPKVINSALDSEELGK